MRIAFLMSADLHADAPNRHKYSYEHDLQFGALHKEGARRGIVFEAVIWDAPNIDWARFDAVLVGTTWDYVQKRDGFFARLEAIANARPLFNPLSLMRWNADKSYLRDLAARGVPTVPTMWADAASAAFIAQAFDAFATTDMLVVKPRIGAGGWRQACLARGAALPPADLLPPAACLVQPFLPAIVEYGEISLLFYDGVFSHCARKRPAIGDYRVQSDYGGCEVAHDPDAGELAVAKAALAALPSPPLYARIDLVRNIENQPVVIEVELIEPYHYVDQGPHFARPFLDGLVKYLE